MSSPRKSQRKPIPNSHPAGTAAIRSRQSPSAVAISSRHTPCAVAQPAPTSLSGELQPLQPIEPIALNLDAPLTYPFEGDPHVAIAKLRAECVRGALELMTGRIEKRLSAHLKKAQQAGKPLDVAEWRAFLRTLSRNDLWFARGYMHEMHDRLMRIIEGQPLAKAIREHGGQWPN